VAWLAERSCGCVVSPPSHRPLRHSTLLLPAGEADRGIPARPGALQRGRRIVRRRVVTPLAITLRGASPSEDRTTLARKTVSPARPYRVGRSVDMTTHLASGTVSPANQKTINLRGGYQGTPCFLGARYAHNSQPTHDHGVTAAHLDEVRPVSCANMRDLFEGIGFLAWIDPNHLVVTDGQHTDLVAVTMSALTCTSPHSADGQTDHS
jgi:hypothetical protein